MNFLGNDKEKAQSTIVDFNNPFNKDSVKSIDISIDNYDWNQCIEFKATVRTKSGNTSGRQEIIGKDFVDLITKIQNYIDFLD